MVTSPSSEPDISVLENLATMSVAPPRTKMYFAEPEASVKKAAKKNPLIMRGLNVKISRIDQILMRY